MSTEIVRPRPNLGLILARRDRANISTPTRLSIWVDAPLVSVEIVQGAEPFNAAAIWYITNVGFGVSLFVFPRNERHLVKTLDVSVTRSVTAYLSSDLVLSGLAQ